jgi:hypothetical protein
MARAPRGERTPLLETRGRFAVFAGLAAFIALDVVLVAIAAHGVAAQPQQTPGPIPTFTSPATPFPEATPTATPTASAAPAASTSGAAPFLSAVSATEAWRVTPVACSGDGAAKATSAKVERTTDGGSTWKTVDLGSNAVDDVVSLSAGSSRDVIVGGRGADCAVAASISYTNGQFWTSSPGDVASTAYLSPSDGSVHLSSGKVAAPCSTPEHVIEGATQTVLLCSDGLEIRQPSGSWTSLGLSGLVAIDPMAGEFTVARTGVSGCSGLDIQSLVLPVVASSTPKNLGCATPAIGAGSLSAANVSLASAGSNLWLWAGGATMVSSDGGVTW